ncbi:unnamed protein product [Urochloa humidicola]
MPPASGTGGQGDDGGFSWLTALGFTFLTFNSGMAIYRSRADLGSVAFVIISYADLVALFACLRWYERSDRNSPAREKIKAAVWLLTILLTVKFSFAMSGTLPLPTILLVWAMAAASGVGGFYTFFLHDDQTRPPQVSRVVPSPTIEEVA